MMCFQLHEKPINLYYQFCVRITTESDRYRTQGNVYLVAAKINVKMFRMFVDVRVSTKYSILFQIKTYLRFYVLEVIVYSNFSDMNLPHSVKLSPLNVNYGVNLETFLLGRFC